MTATDAAIDATDTDSTPGKGALWTGRVLTAIPILMMLMSAGMKFAQPPQVLEMFVGKFGYPAPLLTTLGVLELLCVALYAVPSTGFLGAILVTGYLGGAIATHVRVGDAFVAPLVLGIFVWGGLYLRDERLRALIPLRKPARR